MNITEMTPAEVDTTLAPPGDNGNAVKGFIAIGITILCFGSNLVPIKRHKTGDGMFYQWICCSALWLVGLVVHCVQGFPTFYPLAMLGGFFWATANTTVAPILQTIGLSQGILIWASFNLLSGWVTGRFGLFGLKPEVPPNQVLNYIGMALCFGSAFIYMLIKSQPQQIPEIITDVTDDVDNATVVDVTDVPDASERESLIKDKSEHSRRFYDSIPQLSVDFSRGGDQYFMDRLSPKMKRSIGICMAIVAGMFYGVTFLPVIYIQDNYANPPASQDGLDYVFAHFSGVYLTSCVYFFVYCTFMCNRPRLYPDIVLPSMIAGIFVGIGMASWFVANAEISEAVSFPIVSAAPGVIASLWGIFFFKEIQGLRNFLLLGVAFCVATLGSVLTGLSNG